MLPLHYTPSMYSVVFSCTELKSRASRDYLIFTSAANLLLLARWKLPGMTRLEIRLANLGAQVPGLFSVIKVPK